jgi:SAM-dependent methyltransferase
VQCHFGLDTLSWARLGAIVTGVDFSEKAIGIARALADELALPATFVQANLYDLVDVLDGRFDVVFASNGVLGWLPDLRCWAEVVAHFLAPGGRFYLLEAHPTAWMFDDESAEPPLRVRYPYFEQDEPLRFEYPGSYAVPEAPFTSVEYGWIHSSARSWTPSSTSA